MSLFISAWGLLAGTCFLYVLGALRGFYAKPLFIVCCILLAAQLVVSWLRKSRETMLHAIIGFLFLLLWPVAESLHNWGVRAGGVAGSGVGPDLLSNLPLLGVIAIVVLIFSSPKMKAEGAVATFQYLLFTRPSGGASQLTRKTAALYPDLRICKDVKTGRNVFINGQDRFLHTMIVGPTGGGKTALMLEPMVNQDIEFIAGGGKARVIVVEPDGTFTDKLARYCEELHVSFYRIDVTDPKDFHWNPLEGDPITVAETLTTVLQESSGKNDFFSDVNITVARNTTLLLKLLHGDELTLLDLNETLLDVRVLLKKIGQLNEKVKKRQLSSEETFIADNLIKTFQAELSTDYKKEKYQSVSMGLRQKIGRLIGNPNIRKIMGGRSNFRFEEFLETPGVLLLNTGNNEAGDTFGKFFLLAKNDATLRRPGSEETRTAVFTYVDEYKRYANAKYVTSLTQGRKYRDAQTLAFQNFSQLDLPGDPSFKKEVKGNCRHKIVLSGLEYDDALEASMMTGEQEVKAESLSYQKGVLFRNEQRLNERTEEKARFSANDLMLMDWNQVVYKIVQNKQTLPPAKGVVEYAKRKTMQQLQGSSFRLPFNWRSQKRPKPSLTESQETKVLPASQPENAPMSPVEELLMRELARDEQRRKKMAAPSEQETLPWDYKKK